MEQNTMTAIACLIGFAIEIILIVFGISVIKTIHKNKTHIPTKEERERDMKLLNDILVHLGIEAIENENKTLDMMQNDESC